MTELTQKTTKEQSATLLVVLITNFVNPFAITSLNVAVPHIGTEFSIMATHLTWIILSFTLTTVLLTIPFGRISDIRGREPVLKMGIFIIGVSALCNIFAPNAAWFFAMRALQGVGGAMVFATNISILVDAYPAKRRGWVLGVSVAAVYSGGACGPAFGGILTHYFGWRSVFMLIVILSAIAFTTAMLRLPKKEKNTNPQSLNRGSIILFMASIGLVAYGLTTFMQNIWSYIIFGAGVILSVIFVRHEMNTEIPVIDVRLLKRNRNFSLSNLAALFNYAATFVIAYLMSIYLHIVKGLDADITGIILICQPALQAVISPIAGRLSDKHSPYAMASCGMACCAGSLFMLAFVNEETAFPYIIAALLLVGTGFGIFSSPNANIIMSSVENSEYSMASAMQSTARTLGQVISMAIITIIMTVVIGNKAIEDATHDEIVFDMHISFTVFACICVAGIFISLKRKPGVKS